MSTPAEKCFESCNDHKCVRARKCMGLAGAQTERRDDKNREPSTLVDRLRGIYNIAVNDGAGLLDGKDTYTREFGTTPIQSEAADRIEQLERELAARNEQLRQSCDEYRAEHGGCCATPSAIATLDREIEEVWDLYGHTQNAPPARTSGTTPTERKPSAETSGKPGTEARHVCGLAGFNPMIDPPCPGCAARSNIVRFQNDIPIPAKLPDKAAAG